jgi:phospholipid/cholesterol/gamma-HCH transport system permease protein
MSTAPAGSAELTQPAPEALALSGTWTARGLGVLTPKLDSVHVPSGVEIVADASSIEALDTAAPGCCMTCLGD